MCQCSLLTGTTTTKTEEHGAHSHLSAVSFFFFSFPSSSLSASIEKSELSESSLIASLRLLRTRTLARAETTGWVLLPRITVYPPLEHSASQLTSRRSKCSAIFRTLIPVSIGGFRKARADLVNGRRIAHCRLIFRRTTGTSRRFPRRFMRSMRFMRPYWGRNA